MKIMNQMILNVDSDNTTGSKPRPKFTSLFQIIRSSGGSRGRRLGQLPRAPREGAPKRRGESKNNSNLHNENTWKAQSGNLAQGTRNRRSTSDKIQVNNKM